MMLQQLLQMMRMGVRQPQENDPTHVDSMVNPLGQISGQMQQSSGMNQPPAGWPASLPQASPDPPSYQSPLSGMSSSLPPAHQGFLARFLGALQGRNNPTGVGSQSSAPLQAQRSGGINGGFGSAPMRPQAQGAGGANPLSSMSPEQLQALVKILLQRGAIQ